MAVEIKIDLDASKAFGKAGALKGVLNRLDDNFDGIDIDVGNLDNAVDSITDLADALEDVEDSLDNIGGIGHIGRDGGDVDIRDMVRQAGSLNLSRLGVADGGTDNKDPPLGPGTSKGIARGLEGVFDFDRGTLRADTIEGMQLDEVRAEVADFYFDSRGVTGGRRNLGQHAVPENMLPNADGTVSPRKSPSSVGGAMRYAAMGSVFGKDNVARMWQSRGGFSMGSVKKWRSRQKLADKVRRSFGKLDGVFRKAIPSMKTWYRLIAILLPLLITFAVQALGVAAAMGAIAAAGAAVVGLGLIGHGEDMASSWRNAKEQLSDLKREMFEVFQPTMQAFAPIQAEVFDRLPGMLAPLSDEMREFVQWEDAIIGMFGGIIGWITRAVEGMNDYRAVIEELGFRFGSILGDNIIGFFEWILEEAYANQDALIGLGHALKQLGVALYNVSSIASYFVLTWTPLLNIVVGITEMLRSQTTVAFLSFVTVLWAAAKVALFFYSIWKSFIMLQMMGKLAGLLGMTNLLTAATLRWAAAIAMVTAGLAAVAGYLSFKGMQSKMEHEMATGVGPNGGFGNSDPRNRGGGGGTYNDNRQFNMQVDSEMDYASENSVRDTFTDMSNQKMELGPPAPSGSGS